MSVEDPKPVSKSTRSGREFSLQTQFLYTENMGDVTTFESEIPMIYSLEEIEEAIDNFDERKKIGSGGYGYVYHGILGSKENGSLNDHVHDPLLKGLQPLSWRARTQQKREKEGRNNKAKGRPMF
ncbi:hypothetical protein F3Y22_tig00008653pilonHSYRG00015 [Hibiscus syriacus]|uniref:Uncharacterized protein n=1 Tax=Hibiscus syriacus TaxID=106335 RepID=A0A6A3C8R7_HIBSY|nr:hypothetical protein F3Y22_tig00008653pilonHSYRG00015 [Hibiscus syriacus]